MPLPHILNSQIGTKLHEAFVTNLYRATLIPPTGVVSEPILTEAIVNVTGFKIPGPEVITQVFQTTKRGFASAEIDVIQNITIEFELNLNDAYQLYVLNKIKEWRAKIQDPLTGTRGLKKDYIGQIILENYARDGQIFWTRTLKHCFPFGELSGGAFELDYTSADPQRLSTQWHADYYTEMSV
jgi:hypothetical protein